jgi:nicotinamide mononucleotide (NMN) deamidase PncC
MNCITALIKHIDNYFNTHYLTLALAESVTAGYKQYSLTKGYHTSSNFEG